MEKGTVGERRRRTRRRLVFALLLLCLAAALTASLCLGGARFAPGQALRLLLSPEGGTDAAVLRRIRLPRALMSAVLGGALALSGYLLQTFFGNPIAGPFVLGISSGAKLAVALVMIFLAGRGVLVTSWMLVASAFAGSLLCVAFLLPAARRVRGMASLLVAGIMIGYVCQAATDFAIAFADEADIVNLHSWSRGSFSGSAMEGVGVSLGIVLFSLLCLCGLAKPLSAYRLGEAYAASLGVPVRAFRAALILLSSLLSACVTAFAGPVSFVGIAVPQIARRALADSDPRPLIPCVFLCGAVFCTGCDLLARTVLAPAELAVSAVTAVFGAPVVLAMLLRRRGDGD